MILLDIIITTTARNDDEGRALLSALRFPFRGTTPASESKESVPESSTETKSKKAKESIVNEPSEDSSQENKEET